MRNSTEQTGILATLDLVRRRVGSASLRIDQKTSIQTSVNKIYRILAPDSRLNAEEKQQKLHQALDDLNHLTLAYLNYSVLEAIAERFEQSSKDRYEFDPVPKPQDADLIASLHLTPLDNGEVLIQLNGAGIGEAEGKSRFPYTGNQMTAIHKLLDMGTYIPDRFTDHQKETLRLLGLIQEQRLNEDYLAEIGKKLHKALFPKSVEKQYNGLRMVVPRNARLRLQLHFDENDGELIRFPWELIHDGDIHLIRDDKVEITRYLNLTQHPQSTEPGKTLKILYLVSRPHGLWEDENLTEKDAVLQEIRSYNETQIQVTLLTRATYEQTLNLIRSKNYDIVHFDGHGTYAKKCSNCKALNYPHLSHCAKCISMIKHSKSMGYFAFEDIQRQIDYVNAYDLAPLMLNSGVKLVYLSACQSSLTREVRASSGIAQSLIRSGIPSVLGMQFSIEVSDAAKFAVSFYRHIVRSSSLREALSEGRLTLIRANSWYVPTLYLRAPNEGNLVLLR